MENANKLNLLQSFYFVLQRKHKHFHYVHS